jgi:hypothetical protein
MKTNPAIDRSCHDRPEMILTALVFAIFAAIFKVAGRLLIEGLAQ